MIPVGDKRARPNEVDPKFYVFLSDYEAFDRLSGEQVKRLLYAWRDNVWFHESPDLSDDPVLEMAFLASVGGKKGTWLKSTNGRRDGASGGRPKGSRDRRPRTPRHGSADPVAGGDPPEVEPPVRPDTGNGGGDRHKADGRPPSGLVPGGTDLWPEGVD